MAQNIVQVSGNTLSFHASCESLYFCLAFSLCLCMALPQTLYTPKNGHRNHNHSTIMEEQIPSCAHTELKHRKGCNKTHYTGKCDGPPISKTHEKPDITEQRY